MKVLYFAWMRERIGAGSEEVSPPGTVRTAHDLAGWLAGLDARHGAAFTDLSAVRVAVDQVAGDWNTPVADAREVAFFPPVTGG